MAVVESARPSATLDSASVERVAAFLTHESTQSTPLSERIAFLRKKGISSDDIAAALRKTGLPSAAATATSEVASSSPPWASRLATVLAVVASGAALIRTSATANAAKATAATAATSAAAAAEGTASVHAQLDELAELSKELFARHAATTSAASATASAAAQEAASVRAELVALTTAHRVLQQQQRSVLDQLGELSQSLLEQQRRWLEGAPRVPDVNVVKVDEAAMGGQGGQGGQGGAEGGNGAEGGAKNGAEGGAENGAEGGAENGAEGGAENGASAQRIRALERQLAEDEQRLVAVAAGEACAMEAIAEAIAFGEHEASAQDGASDQYGAMGIEATSASADAAPDAAPGAAPDVAPDAAPDAAMWASVLHGWKVEETPATAPCGQAAASTATPANDNVPPVASSAASAFAVGVPAAAPVAGPVAGHSPEEVLRYLHAGRADCLPFTEPIDDSPVLPVGKGSLVLPVPVGGGSLGGAAGSTGDGHGRPAPSDASPAQAQKTPAKQVDAGSGSRTIQKDGKKPKPWDHVSMGSRQSG